MEVIRIKGFQLYMSNGDGIGSTPTAYTRKEQVGKDYAAKTKNWGGYKPFSETFIIIDSLDELEAMEREKIRDRALNKLTKEEKEVLGL